MSNARSDIETVRRFGDAAFSARGVETGYGDLQVLYGVDIDVREDEVVLVFGPNGAGKSTLMRALYKQLPLWDGSIRIDDDDYSHLQSNEMVRDRKSVV